MTHAIQARQLRAALLAGSALVSGCGIGFGARPTPPPEPIAIGVYTRGAPAQGTFSYVVTSEHADARIGEVSVEPRGGCFFVGGAWTLEVHDSERPDPADEPIATLEGPDPPTTPVELAITVDGAGRVEVTEGTPAWWTADRQRCGH